MRLRADRRSLVTRILLVALVPCALLATFAHGAGASGKDTPELVMQAAAQTGQHTQSLTRALQRAMEENNAYIQHVQTDRNYAAAVLAANQKGDRAALVQLMKQFSPSGDITITQLATDITHHWHKVIKTQDGDITIDGCISTDGGCNGGFVSVTVK